MKKGLLFIVAMIMMVSTIEAKIIEKTSDRLGYNRSLRAQPIVFIEKGIQFSIFPNGKFKFTKANFKNRWNLRNHRWKHQRGVNILWDRKGRISKVGNVQIFYTRNNKVIEIGSVDLNYKHGKLKKVGNLHILYRPNGTIKYIGKVKHNRRTYFSRKPLIWS
jgi:hypothetical protein